MRYGQESSSRENDISTDCDKRRREPALAICYLAPPPVLVEHVHHLDDVTGAKPQLKSVEGHVVPQSFRLRRMTLVKDLGTRDATRRNINILGPMFYGN